MEFSNLITYFRDCYEADNARATIWKIFHANIEHRIFAGDEELLLTGTLEHAPIDIEKGKAAAGAAYLYRKEKELMYCSLFVVGRLRIEEDREPQAICSPLLMYPAEILEIDGRVFLKADLDNLKLNYLLVDAIQSNQSSNLAEELAERIEERTLDSNFIPATSQLLEIAAPGLDTSLLFRYPSLVSERELREAYKSASDDPSASLRLMPCSLAALVKKSVETRGVLNELMAIAQEESLSVPLRMAFGGGRDAVRANRTVARAAAMGRVPAILSAAQKQILESAAASPLTLVIGPPGTGKSYTIAAVAMEHLGRGQSVLIASKMNHAVDVVSHKIEQQLEIQGCVIRGGRKQYLKEFKTYLEQLLTGIHTSGPSGDSEISELERELRNLDHTAADLEDLITRYCAKEVSWGRVLGAPPQGLFNRLNRAYVHWRTENSAPLWGLLEQLEKQLEERVRKTSILIRLLNRKRLQQALARHRADFTTFLKALRARTGGKQEDLFNTVDFKILFTAFPVWLVNLSDIHDVLPLRQDLFDVAIIDEATQCDIASCLPVLYRARRAVIVGDPNQLRHLSFLSAQRQQELIEKCRVPVHQQGMCEYREKSVLDLVNENIAGQDHVVFLDEHFRSAPPIIQFSNQTFYGNSLHIMTEKPGESLANPLTLRRVDGRRAPEGENPEEARLLVQDVVSKVNSEEALDPDLSHSIGILSPFRGQVDYISRHLSQALSPDAFSKHDILIGTAHTFQGEERDVMFISLALDSNSPAASLRFLEKRDVFNVSITRARIGQQVYISLNPSRLGRESLLGSYLEYINRSACSQHASKDVPRALRDPFLLEFKRELERLGCQVWPAYSIAGLVMDMVVLRNGQSCGIDMIGCPGDFSGALSLERYKMFHRAGLKMVPIPYSRWLTNKKACLDAVEKNIATGLS
jgi:hypothetical protein